jgi:hypothetical protein
MQIDPVNFAIAVFTGITAVAATATYFVYRRQAIAMEAQLRTTREQIDDLRQSRDGQQLYQVITMLLDIRPDIERVLSLRHRPLDQWSEEEKSAAYNVSGRLQLTGLLVLQKVVPEELFAKAWYYSIPTCHEILQPFIKAVRAERDQRYWSAFDYLAERVRLHSGSFTGFASSQLVPRAKSDG